MSLSYEKIAAKDQKSDSSWTAYADLFMMLSIVFLLLYVVSSLRSTSSSLQSRLEYQRAVMETEDLRAQNKVYNALKEEYLAQQATQNEQEVYAELMDKLSLLQDKAKEEKEGLRRQALENEKKEVALNHYQQIIRNIINANVVAKARLKTSDDVIQAKREQIKENETIIGTQSREVESLKKSIQEKEAAISQNNARIEQINASLDLKIKELKETQKKQKTSKEKLEKQIAALRDESQQKVKVLEEQNQVVSAQLSSATGELASTKNQLEKAAGTIEEQEAEKARLAAELAGTREQFNAKISKMRGDFAAEMAAKEKAFQEGLDKEKLSAAERSKKEAEFRAAAKRDADALGGRIADLENKMKGKDAALAQAEAASQEYKKFIDDLQKQKEGLADDLAKSKEQLAAKRKLAKQIRENLKKAGIAATVDGKTGDVILSFGDQYFETSKADLNPAMEKILKKFVPAYASSLFKDKHIAEQIGSVEIVGFASPTFRGKYVDPQSLVEEDRAAVTYNMDLSYQRANSIFRYMFDTSKMKYEEQKRLLPLVKVTGRSYLVEGVKGRNLQSGVKVEDFCSKYDCKREQRVIIKFNLKE